MRHHVLYAYVEGSDLSGIEDEVLRRFSSFVSGRRWLSGDASVVNQKRDQSARDSGWELGMNLELPNPHEEPDGWFADVEAIAIFVRDLAEKFGVEFVIGISDRKRGFSEDLFSIDAGPINIEALQAIIGVAPK
jgi:hypothetical protein